MERTIHIEPFGKQFEVKDQSDLVILLDYLRKNVLNKPGKLAIIFTEIWKEQTVRSELPQ